MRLLVQINPEVRHQIAGRVRRAAREILSPVEPRTPVTRSGRDIFNFNATGRGIKWLSGLMARPWKDISLTEPGQAFERVKNTGEGLSRNERQMSLAVIQPTRFAKLARPEYLPG